MRGKKAALWVLSWGVGRPACLLPQGHSHPLQAAQSSTAARPPGRGSRWHARHHGCTEHSTQPAPVAVARAGAPRAPRALLRAGLADPAHFKARQPRRRLQQALLGAASVHHIADACRGGRGPSTSVCCPPGWTARAGTAGTAAGMQGPWGGGPGRGRRPGSTPAGTLCLLPCLPPTAALYCSLAHPNPGITWDGQRRLGHVGGHHHQAVARGRQAEHARLLRRRQHRVQRQHMQRAWARRLRILAAAAAALQVCRQRGQQGRQHVLVRPAPFLACQA